MNPELEYLVLAESTTTDSDTGRVSIFGIFDGIWISVGNTFAVNTFVAVGRVFLNIPTGPMTEIPAGAPKVGEIYRHYKGNDYKILDLALHSNDDEWMVVYEPIYDEPVAHLFTRPLHEWREMVEWDGETVPRFILVQAK